MSSRYKVLQLDSWMKCAYYKNEFLLSGFKRTVEYFKEISPIFNRDGRYYDRYTKTYWFEVNGKAYTGDRSMFIYDLEMLSTKRLTVTERDALQKLINLNTDLGISMIATKLLMADASIRHIRKLHIDSTRIRKHVLIKYKKES